MKRSTQNTLYYLLPVLFWLSAVGGSILAYRQWSGYIVTLIALLAVHIIHRIPRRAESVEQSFQVAVLLGIASYWMPTVLFLIVPIWLYLIYQNIFSLRSFVATFIGLALVAVWAALAIMMGWLPNAWMDFFASKNALGWIPVGAFLIAYIASTIARQTLRER